MTTSFRLQRAVRAFEAALSQLGIARRGSGRVDLHVDAVAFPGVAWLTLNHPAKRNAVDQGMMLDLAGHVEDLSVRASEGGDVRAVVLRGAGGHFCAGADFSLASALRSPEQGLVMLDLMTATLDGLLDLPCVSVAAVQGHAKGGGAEILTSCDFRVFSERSAHVQFVHTKMAISPGWGGALRLREIVGRGRALRLLAMAEPLQGGQSALDFGLADAVVAEEEAGRGDSSSSSSSSSSSDVDAYSAVDREAVAFLDPILRAESAASILAVKHAVAGGGVHAARTANSRTRSGMRADDDERRAFSSVWGADDNQRAVDAAVARLRR